MERYICIHGHFYQPPRENPWLEDVELQDSAHPYHDWNAKITDECYKQNAASRILGPDKKIIDIVNNYTRISFDFGPTLLSWLEKHAPEVYESIIVADQKSQEIFTGHGAALAHAYNHIIMPLANRRDKYTQIVWGICDFEHRFGRKPEGMWLPETAVDMETLDILAEHEIKFTILAPHQAGRIREIGNTQWVNIEKEKIDTTRTYLCQLPSGRRINVFFYHGPTTRDVADGRILQNGAVFAKQLARIISEDQGPARLAHIATDGETYGHHHRYTDMALAYCLHYIESEKLAQVTIYGEYREKFPPTYEVEINENSSWSCSHGIERWRSNCGCHYGRYPSGRQPWRAPLREAMDWLRDQLALVYEKKTAQYVPDPWHLRNKYIAVVNDRSAKNVQSFMSSSVDRKLAINEKVTLLKLLEMQRNAMLMYTSCGWFFDDICGMETVQIMQYAARAIQLAKEIDEKDLEAGFTDILAKAPTNVKEYTNGKEVYNALVKPGSIDLNRVGAHLAISSIFEESPDKSDIYCYATNIESYDRINAGIQILATGRAAIQSNIVLEKHTVDFAVLHFGDHNLIAAVNTRMPDQEFSTMHNNLGNAFAKGNTTEVMRLMNISFGGNNYSLWHLFKDQQRIILFELLRNTWQQIEASFRHIYEHNYTIIQIMRGMNMPLPKALSTPIEFILNKDLCEVIRDDEIDLKQLKKLVDEANKLSLPLDETTLRFEASRKINQLMYKLEHAPGDVELLEKIVTTLKMLLGISSKLDLQAAQNVFFAISRENYPVLFQKAMRSDKQAQEWIEHFKDLAQHLGVKVE
ncbi:MAG: glycoside hydrolase [Phycisphaerae bacterium SM23_30]|nr:MAG: glycoside hydrolase [Phycisphaerae bacterium SM23_30]